MRKAGLMLVLFTLCFGYSWACECIFPANYSLKDQIKGSSVIFYAEVVSIEDPKDPNFEWIPDLMFDSLYYEKQGYEPQFRVIEVLRGDLDAELKGDRVFYQSMWSMCDSTFKLGEKYLVFAYQDGNGKIRTDACSPKFIFEDQKDYKAKRKEIKRALRQKVS